MLIKFIWVCEHYHTEFKYNLIFVKLSFVKLAPDHHGLNFSYVLMYIDCRDESGEQ